MGNKPGEMALEAFKKLNSKISVFKVPLAPQGKRSKMKILTEEKYIEELGKIIQKDFFPDLEKLKAQNDYLDAAERNDFNKMKAIQAKYSVRTPLVGARIIEVDPIETPATFETPQMDSPDRDTDSLLSSTRSRKRKMSSTISVTSSKSPSDGHSIDSFLANYTSEDNNSFQELIETADKKLRQKFAVLYEAEQHTAAAIAHSLELPSIENQYKAIEGTKQVDMWTYTNRNYIMYVPDGVELTKEEQLEMATNKQEIEYSNTRLRHNPFDDLQSKETITEMAREQAKVISGRIGVDGNSLNKPNRTPNIRGFNFVHTPSATPIIDGSASPLMTWGELEGTPFRLDGSDTPYRASSGPAFRITETSRRENIALELAEKAGKRMRDQKTKALEAAKQNISSPHIRSSLDRLAVMSPAAKKLATSSLRLRDSLLSPSPGSVSTTPIYRDKSWTPKTKSATPSPLVKKKKATAIGVSSHDKAAKAAKAADENRNRAADFF